jgi:hypothetical protein
LSKVLGIRSIPEQGKRFLDEVSNVTYDITAQGQAQNAMEDKGQTRMVGNGFIRTTIKGGNSGTNYLVSLVVELVSGRILDFRATVRVKDVSEPT